MPPRTFRLEASRRTHIIQFAIVSACLVTVGTFTISVPRPCHHRGAGVFDDSFGLSWWWFYSAAKVVIHALTRRTSLKSATQSSSGMRVSRLVGPRVKIFIEYMAIDAFCVLKRSWFLWGPRGYALHGSMGLMDAVFQLVSFGPCADAVHGAPGHNRWGVVERRLLRSHKGGTWAAL